MSGFRSASPLGGITQLLVDSGTLARTASLPPGPDAIANQLRNWLRQETRHVVTRSLPIAVDLACEVVRQELRKLGNDLEAQLALIARLPEDLRNRVAYEFFASFFDHYLPKKLVRHYVYGRGATLTLTKQEMVDCNPYITLLRSKAFRALLSSSLASGSGSNFKQGVLAGALTNGSLGQFTANVEGHLTVQSDGSWTASGKMSFYDEWDFDPKDFSTGGRSFQGEMKTRFAHYTLPGRGFKIQSEKVEFSQDQDSTSVQWVGGVPKAVPDRLASMDTQLGNAE